MSLRLALAPLAVCAVLAGGAQNALAQTGASAAPKVAIVNLQQAVFNTAEIKKADAEMQARYKPRQDEIAKISNDGNALVQKLQAGQQTLSESAQADLQAEIQKKQRDLQRLQEDLQADSERERNAILSSATQKMAEVVKKLAEERGLDVVVEAANTLYVKPAFDITQEATAAYDKANPASAAAAPAAATKPAAK